MKKKIIISTILIVLIVTAVLLPYAIYNGLEKNKSKANLEMVYSEKVYIKNNEGLLVGIEVPLAKEIAEVELVKDDLIKQKWELLTTKQNLLPTGYKSVLPNDATLESYNIDEGKLTINTNESIKEALGRQAVEAVAWTFCNHDITEVEIIVNEEKVNTFDDFHFKKISKDIGINFKYETMFLYEANYTTVVTEKDGVTLPVTYVHLETDECDYIVSKVLGNNVTKTLDEVYSYQLTEKTLSFQFLDKSLLTSNVLNNLSESVYLNMNIDKFTINDTESVLYEISYVIDTNK